MKEILLSFFILATLMGFMFLVGTIAEKEGFEKGQISALSGDVQYHLVTNDVKEIVWEKIK
jgi:hypothetical protein